MRFLPLVVAMVVVGVFLLNRTLFVVYPWATAMVVQFGEVVSVKTDSGFYFKTPWQDLFRFDKRILTIDNQEAGLYITQEKENLLIDSYIKWRISDPRTYYVRFAGREENAVARINDIINRGLRDEISKQSVRDVVSGKRSEVMSKITSRANLDARDVGLEIVDVRLKRVELPVAVSENVYKNMIEERRRIANERRSKGDAEKERIQARADRDRTIILAEAVRDAQGLRGEGDALAANIYSTAYGQHAAFFEFWRTLEAYRKSLGQNGDYLILSPKGEFFKYFDLDANAKNIFPEVEVE